jgi:CheY-like chemotaxis protein
MTDPAPSKPTGIALVVCEDASAIEQLIVALQKFAIAVKICADVNEAMDLLDKRKFEAVIVDFLLGYPAVGLLQQVHDSPSNRTAVTFAMTGSRDDATRALQKGAHFLLERPLTAEALGNTIRAAYGSILRERRRYFRYPISVPVLLRRQGKPQLPGQVMNISERGMALKTPVSVPAGSEATLQFVLPDLPAPITVEAKVCWSNDQGHAGVQFVSLSTEASARLSAWLAQRLEEQLPKNVTQKFGSPTDI